MTNPFSQAMQQAQQHRPVQQQAAPQAQAVAAPAGLPSADDIFETAASWDGPKGKPFKFGTIGDIVEGTVVSEPRSVQQYIYGTKDLAWTKTGKPKMQVIITLQTELRDPDDPADTGLRTLFAKMNMQKAIGKAMVAAGGKKIRPGGILAVGYIGDVPSETPGFRASQDYVAQYTPPDVVETSNIFMEAAKQPSSSGPAVVFNQHEPTRPTASGTTLDQLKNTSFNGRGEPQSSEIPF